MMKLNLSPAMLALLALLVSACGNLAGPSRTLYLARHGQTEWNRLGRFQGDPDLDQVGAVNRVNLWLLLKKEKLAAIYTSELLRTKRTAELVARAQGMTIQPRAALNEIKSGVLEGICFGQMDPKGARPGDERCNVPSRGSRPHVTLKEIQRIWTEAKAKGLEGRVPQGENYPDMVKRIGRFKHELIETLQRGQVLVVGHGVINRILLHALLGWPLENVRKLRQENDQVYKIEGIGTKRVKVQMHTPGMGWADCSPPKPGQRYMDCNPGPDKGVGKVEKPEPESQPASSPSS